MTQNCDAGKAEKHTIFKGVTRFY